MRKLAELTLWHGTVIDNYDSIKRYGLQAGIGNFVKQFYDEDDVELEELIFMADKTSIKKATGAMVAHIARKLNKDRSDVTDEDIERYGLLVKVKGSEGAARSPIEYYDPEDPNRGIDHPHTVEPRDHYTSDSLGVSDLFIGKNLVKVLKRYNAWPAADHIFSNPTQKTRDYLVELVKMYDPERSIEQIRTKIETLSGKDVLKYINQYKTMLREKKSMPKVIKAYLMK